LSVEALDLVLRAECVQEDAASALTAVDVELMYQEEQARGHINIEEEKA
jgi:hypothetical protein